MMNDNDFKWALVYRYHQALGRAQEELFSVRVITSPASHCDVQAPQRDYGQQGRWPPKSRVHDRLDVHLFVAHELSTCSCRSLTRQTNSCTVQAPRRVLRQFHEQLCSWGVRERRRTRVLFVVQEHVTSCRSDHVPCFCWRRNKPTRPITTYHFAGCCEWQAAFQCWGYPGAGKKNRGRKSQTTPQN